MSVSPTEAAAFSGRRSLWSGLLQSLTRVTSGGRFVPCVDGVRCIAIMAVLLYHLNGYIVARATGFSEAEARQTFVFHLLHGASCGVQLFFAISGFILALPFAREQLTAGQPVRLKHYFWRRVTRLEPPFLINLALIYLLLVLVKHRSATELLPSLLATMTYTHNWIYGQLSAINAVAWSLEIEVQFYIIAPFLARWYFRSPPARRRLLMAGMVCLLIGLKIMWPVTPAQKLRLGLAYTLDHFLVGIMVADLFVFHWKERPAGQRLWDLVALVVLPSVFLIQLDPRTYHLLPVLSGLLLVSAFRGPLTNRVLTTPLIVVTGGMCYSIYLYHFLVISMVGRFTISGTVGYGYLPQLVIQSIIIVPVVVAVCAVFFAAIEKPFMKWRPVRVSA
ncbi:MAG: acyltransferase [Fuerstiella sp.]